MTLTLTKDELLFLIGAYVAIAKEVLEFRAGRLPAPDIATLGWLLGVVSGGVSVGQKLRDAYDRPERLP